MGEMLYHRGVQTEVNLGDRLGLFLYSPGMTKEALGHPRASDELGARFSFGWQGASVPFEQLCG